MLKNALKRWMRKTKGSEPWLTDPLALLDICELYWSSPPEIISLDAGEDGLQARYESARQELLSQPMESYAWALDLAARSDPQARLLGAERLASAARAAELGLDEDLAHDLLIRLLDLPLRSRWDQITLETAVGALGVLGRASATPALVRILLSEDREYMGDTQWSVAAALEQIASQSFLHERDPIEAARRWARLQGFKEPCGEFAA